MVVRQRTREFLELFSDAEHDIEFIMETNVDGNVIYGGDNDGMLNLIDLRASTKKLAAQLSSEKANQYGVVQYERFMLHRDVFGHAQRWRRNLRLGFKKGVRYIEQY